MDIEDNRLVHNSFSYRNYEFYEEGLLLFDEFTAFYVVFPNYHDSFTRYLIFIVHIGFAEGVSILFESLHTEKT